MKVTCSEIRIYKNSYEEWKSIFVEGAKLSGRYISFGRAAHCAVYAALKGEPLREAIEKVEVESGIIFTQSERERVRLLLRNAKNIGIAKTEIFVRNEGFSLIGRVDGVAENGMPVEFKFGKVTPGDCYQAAAYALCLKVPEALTVYPYGVVKTALCDKYDELIGLIEEIKAEKKKLMGEKYAPSCL
ncbi:MAG: hypothetical protein QXP42_02085 [Candidatus Micrarchaeia archaeon]